MAVQLNTRGTAIGQALDSGPPIIRGVLNLNKYIEQNGGTLGTGVSTAARQANAVAINQGISDALANNLIIEAFPARCEIDNSSGVTFMPSATFGGVWRGAGFGIVQYAVNAPCFTIGDASGTNARAKIDIDGLNVSHGTDQAGQTLGDALRIGYVFWSRFRNISAGVTGQSGGARSYRSCDIDGNSSAFYFSNTMEDCIFAGGYDSILRISNFGTQNYFKNIYCQGGGGGVGAQTVTYPIFFNAGGTAMSTNVFECLNVEWCTSARLIYGDVARGFEFNGVHFEGNNLTGSNPAFFEFISSDGFAARGVLALNNRCLAADGATGTGAIVRGTWFDRAELSNVTIRNESGTSKFDLPFYAFYNGTSGARQGSVSFRNLSIVDNSSGRNLMTNFRLHTSLSQSAYLNGSSYMLNVTEMHFNSVIPRIQNGCSAMTDADHTHYAILEDFTYRRDVTGSVDRTLTLSNKRGPVGSAFANIPAKAGQTVCVTRTTGWANPIIVKNHDGTTLASLTGEANVAFYFNGTDWVLV